MVTKINEENINDFEREVMPLTKGEMKAQSIRFLIAEAEKRAKKQEEMRQLTENNLPTITKQQRVNAIRKMYNQIEKIFLESKNVELTPQELSRLIAIQYSLDFYLGKFGNKMEKKTREKLLRRFFDVSLAEQKFTKLVMKENKLVRRIKKLKLLYKQEREKLQNERKK
jgi:hypothetical protein